MDIKKLQTLTRNEIDWVIEMYGPAKSGGIILLGLSAAFYIPLGMLIGWALWG